jgi:hypothetical protein
MIFQGKAINLMQKKLLIIDISVYVLLSTKTARLPEIENHRTQNHSVETQVA